MRTIHIIVGAAFACLTAWIVVVNLKEWRKLPPEITGWARWRATAQNSATVLWGKFSLAVAGVVANLDTFFDTLGLPSVGDAINKWLSPRAAAACIAVIAIGSILTRKRTL